MAVAIKTRKIIAYKVQKSPALTGIYGFHKTIKNLSDNPMFPMPIYIRLKEYCVIYNH
jgi:hypothetical protein